MAGIIAAIASIFLHVSARNSWSTEAAFAMIRIRISVGSARSADD